MTPQATSAPSLAASPVKMFDYRAQLAAMRSEIMTAIAEVLDSGQLILGPRVKRFEENFRAWLGAAGECVGVGNGTDAIALALRALDIGPGDEVLTVANTAIPTVSAIRMTGAMPVFCDVEPATLLIDLNDAERRVTPRTKAIVPVHLFGNAVDMDAVLDFARRHNLRVVEDCAQSTGTTWRGQATGTFGDVSCFSFYPTKNLGAYGDGGLCFTRDKSTAETLRRLRFYGCGQTYYAEQEGVNSRLDEMQAAILDVKLTRLTSWIERRREIAAMYDARLDGHVQRPRVGAHAQHSYHLYVVAVDERSDIMSRLKSAGIACGIHYPTPIHLMRGYDFLKVARGTLPVTEQAAERVLSLPCYPELADDEVQQVADALVLS